MKYIRTKDEIIEFGKKYLITTGKIKGKGTRFGFRELTEENFEKMKEENRWEIIKQADTIEELCDEFVYKYKTGKEKPHITISVYNYDDINIVREHIKKMYDEQTKVYGAIWTDKGLIYVAKMNEKGELELL